MVQSHIKDLVLMTLVVLPSYPIAHYAHYWIAELALGSCWHSQDMLRSMALLMISIALFVRLRRCSKRVFTLWFYLVAQASVW